MFQSPQPPQEIGSHNLGARCDSMFKLYKITILSINYYGCPIYASASESALKIFNPVHCQGIRLRTDNFHSPGCFLYCWMLCITIVTSSWPYQNLQGVVCILKTPCPNHFFICLILSLLLTPLRFLWALLDCLLHIILQFPFLHLLTLPLPWILKHHYFCTIVILYLSIIFVRIIFK